MAEPNNFKEFVKNKRVISEEGHLIPGMLWRNLDVDIYDREYIEDLQRENAAKAKRKERVTEFCPQPGFQEKVLDCQADIVICGGRRGSGKSAIMTFLPLYEAHNPLFSGYGFRKEEKDIIKGLWATSKIFYTGLAEPVETTLTWNFPSGAKQKYEHLQNEANIDRRFRGVELPLIFVDEVTQINEKSFFTLLASNRNSIGCVNKFVGSCNPVSKKHWLHKLISWYIDEDTKEIIKERNGQIRYFYKHGDSVDDIIWGDSKEEVYEKAKGFIDYLLDGDEDPYSLISSLCFIEGEYKENKIFKALDSSYKGRLVQQGSAQAAKDIKGLWDDDDETEAQLSSVEFEEKFMNNPEPQIGNRIRSCVIDVALTKDFMVLYAFEGNHVFDIDFFTGVFSDDAVVMVDNFLNKNSIREENMVFDENGLGIYLKGFFRKAKGFNNKASASNPRLWKNQKSECCEKFITAVKQWKYSISEDVLNRKITLKGGVTVTVGERLLIERKVLQRKSTNEGVFEIISKPAMKVLIGHSPDFIEGLIMHEMIVDKKERKFRNIGML